MSKQHQSAHQMQIVDHNYLNNTFLTTLSTLESLKLITENKHKQQYQHKLFTSYDKIDYSSKNLLQLQSQFQTHLIIFRAAIKCYLADYKTAWSPPSNFDTQKASCFILQAMKFFQERGDDISERFTNDFIQLIQGVTNDLFIDHVQIKGIYTQFEKMQHNKSLFVNSAKARDIMEEEKLRIENLNLNSINDLRANLNPNYGLPIEYRYLIVEKEQYEQYYQGNSGFQASVINQPLLLNKQQVLSRLKRCNTLRRNNNVGIEFEIFNGIVTQTRLLK